MKWIGEFTAFTAVIGFALIVWVCFALVLTR